jgi:hypothetical protein
MHYICYNNAILHKYLYLQHDLAHCLAHKGGRKATAARPYKISGTKRRYDRYVSGYLLSRDAKLA